MNWLAIILLPLFWLAGCWLMSHILPSSRQARELEEQIREGMIPRNVQTFEPSEPRNKNER